MDDSRSENERVYGSEAYWGMVLSLRAGAIVSRRAVVPISVRYCEKTDSVNSRPYEEKTSDSR
jgi:hypothetical protein